MTSSTEPVYDEAGILVSGGWTETRITSATRVDTLHAIRSDGARFTIKRATDIINSDGTDIPEAFWSGWTVRHLTGFSHTVGVHGQYGSVAEALEAIDDHGGHR